MVALLEQLVRTQLLLREVNNRIADAFGGMEEIFVGEDALAQFLCECGNDYCKETLPLSLLEYQGIRSSPNLFVVLPGHEAPEVDRLIEARPTFELVEKTTHVNLVFSGHQRSGLPEGR